MALPAHAPVSACPRRLPFVINPLITHTHKKIKRTSNESQKRKKDRWMQFQQFTVSKKSNQFFDLFPIFFFFEGCAEWLSLGNVTTS